MGGGSCQAVATRWRRVRDLRTIRWRRVARNQEALHRAGHQRQLRSNKHAFGDLVQSFKWAQTP